MKKIIPNLWFDKQAEEAAHFYTSVFKNSKIGRISRYDKASSEVSGMPEGEVMTIEFELDGQQFVGLNGGPLFKFNEAVSFVIDCKDQEEVDYYWNKLTDGGEEQPCGWLKDKFGLSWQVVPDELTKMLPEADPQQSQRVAKALMQMKKINIQVLREAYKNPVNA